MRLERLILRSLGVSVALLGLGYSFFDWDTYAIGIGAMLALESVEPEQLEGE